MSRRFSRALAAVGAAIVAAATIAAACARESDAQVASARSEAAAPSDTAALAWLLRAVRGADPLLCELAINSADRHGHWSNWGSLGESPLEANSAAAAVIDWIQDDHKDASMVPQLTAGIRDDDACVRRVAGAMLGRVQHPTARGALIAALADPRPEVRYVAAFGAGLGEVAEAQQTLVRLLRDDSPLVRRAAAWALGAMEQSSALPQLIDVLERDPDARVRQTAAWAIGRSHE